MFTVTKTLSYVFNQLKYIFKFSLAYKVYVSIGFL